MLSTYFHAAARIREIRSSPAGTFIERFAEALFERGYAPITARRYIRSAEHIAYWAGRRCLVIYDLDDEALRHFGRHLSRCHCGHFARASRREVMGGVRLFIRHLQGIDEPAIKERAATAGDSMRSFDQGSYTTRPRSNAAPIQPFFALPRLRETLDGFLRCRTQ